MSFSVYKSDYRRQPFTYHEKFGWWHLPNFYARLALGKTWHNFQTNEHGMRDAAAHEYKKNPDIRWLAFLGDSYTAGDGVSNTERFGEAVKKYAQPGLETLNFGLNSSGTDQQLLIFENMARSFEVDGYVWGICVENIIRNLCNCRPSWDFAEHKAVYRPKPFFKIVNGKLEESASPISRETIDAAHVGQSDWTAFPQKYIKTNSIYDLYKDKHAYPWQLMKEIIERMIWKAEGKPVFLMPLPMVDHYLHGMKPYYMERFAELHQPQNNVFVIDVLPAFLDKPESLRNIFRFPDDPHYTIHAHDLAAQVLAHSIQRDAPHIYYGEGA